MGARVSQRHDFLTSVAVAIKVMLVVTSPVLAIYLGLHIGHEERWQLAAEAVYLAIVMGVALGVWAVLWALGRDRPLSTSADGYWVSNRMTVVLVFLFCGGFVLPPDVRSFLADISGTTAASGAAILAAGAAIGHVRGDSATAGYGRAGGVAAAAAALLWGLSIITLPSLQGRALFEATVYVQEVALPVTTQPRLLPKAAAERFADWDDMRRAHLVVSPDTGELVWSAERKPGILPRTGSVELGVQPLDRTDGTLRRIPLGFTPAVSRVGPGSIKWRAYRRHYFTRLEDPVIVPLDDARAVALVPYTGYRGFPVRRPYWKGVYVYHRDGRLEDLTPEEPWRDRTSCDRDASSPSGSRATSPRRTATGTASSHRCAAARARSSATPRAIASRI